MAETAHPNEARKPHLKIEDRRRFAVDSDPTDGPAVGGDAPTEPPAEDPAVVALRERADAAERRAEAAERKAREFQDAYTAWRTEQDQVRARLERDVERKAEIRFGDLAVDVLAVVDDLDLALEHARGIEAAEPLSRGVAMARDRFLLAANRLGLERLELDGEEFDPNVAEAVGVEIVEDPSRAGRVVRTLQTGYRFKDRVIRPARVLVARVAE